MNRVVNVRVLFEISLVAPGLLTVALLPMSAMLLLMAIECVVLYLPLRKQAAAPPDHENPAQLKPAIAFGVLYAMILFVVAAARDIFGDQALYWIAGISGLTDVDAIDERLDAVDEGVASGNIDACIFVS